MEQRRGDANSGGELDLLVADSTCGLIRGIRQLASRTRGPARQAVVGGREAGRDASSFIDTPPLARATWAKWRLEPYIPTGTQPDPTATGRGAPIDDAGCSTSCRTRVRSSGVRQNRGVPTLLLSGACGSGKSTLLTLGYRAWNDVLGPTATFDTDSLLMMVDPRWELAHEERRLDLMFEQCGLLASSFQRSGLAWVVIGGNALHTPEEIVGLVAALLQLGDVFHVTLDPSVEIIQRRIARRGGDKTDEWLETHVEWMRAKYDSWTARVDNSDHAPLDTLRGIAARVARGEGQLTEAWVTRP